MLLTYSASRLVPPHPAPAGVVSSRLLSRLCSAGPAGLLSLLMQMLRLLKNGVGPLLLRLRRTRSRLRECRIIHRLRECRIIHALLLPPLPQKDRTTVIVPAIFPTSISTASTRERVVPSRAPRAQSADPRSRC